ncbi:MAG: hypothetical protein ABR584_08845 [Candidatus Baltobacteraceae bacterium]
MRSVIIIAAVVFAMAAPANAQSLTDPYQIFATARHSWLMQSYPASVSYVVGVQALGDDLAAKHYQLTYNSRTNTVIPDRVSIEQRENPHVPTGININIDILGGSRTLNPEKPADPFGIPMLAPNYSFGVAPPIRAHATDTKALIAQLRAEYPDPMVKGRAASTNDLVEIGSVTAVHHDYVMQLVGVERDDQGDAYHLALQPTHDPWHYRLRDVWIDTNTYCVHKLISAGNFTGGLATKARWLVKFDKQDGVQYLHSEETIEPVTAHGLLGIGEQTWSGWRITFEAVTIAPQPFLVSQPLGDETFLTEPE